MSKPHGPESDEPKIQRQNEALSRLKTKEELENEPPTLKRQSHIEPPAPFERQKARSDVHKPPLIHQKASRDLLNKGKSGTTPDVDKPDTRSKP